MRSPVVAAFAVLAAASGAQAASSPQILIGKGNGVPACVTPQRLMAFVQEHNKSLPPKLREIAADYKKHGDDLHVRWDYAFYQMVVETNYLKFLAPGGRRGDVAPGQNNFAGLGATGHRAPGESFPDVDTGVLAHLQHVRLYSGDPVENPVAERTKLVTDLILPWAQSLKHPVTFADLTHKWAPSGHSYADAIEGVADLFRQSQCTGAAASEQTADASDAAGEAPAKAPAKPATKIAALAVKKAAAPPPVDEAVADASDEAAPASADLAGPALKKAAKVAVTAIKAPALSGKAPDVDGDGQPDSANEQVSATEGETSAVADAAPVKIAKMTAKPVAAAAGASSEADFNGETVSAAAGKVVKAAKLPVAATVVAPAPDASSEGTDVANADQGGDGEGGATEVIAPVVKAAAAKTTPAKVVAAKVVPKAIVIASAADVPVLSAKAKARAVALETADAASTTTETTTEDAASSTQLASMTVPAKIEPAKNCKVFTASYGGGKSLLIQSSEGDHTRFTALTVNEAKADTQAKAFINVYAKGGKMVGEFGTQNEALTKAFQLCPES